MVKETDFNAEQNGFTLMEMVLVILIIGVLAGVGLPQYQRMSQKARQSEVKTFLGVMHTSQQMFYREWNQYYADFSALGFHVEGDLGYHLGFAAPGIIGPDTHDSILYNNKAPTIIDTKKFCDTVNYCSVSKANSTKLVSGTTVAKESYSFGGTANLDSDSNLDEWSIDQDKKLTQHSDDINL